MSVSGVLPKLCSRCSLQSGIHGSIQETRSRLAEAKKSLKGIEVSILYSMCNNPLHCAFAAYVHVILVSYPRGSTGRASDAGGERVPQGSGFQTPSSSSQSFVRRICEIPRSTYDDKRYSHRNRITGHSRLPPKRTSCSPREQSRRRSASPWPVPGPTPRGGAYSSISYFGDRFDFLFRLRPKRRNPQAESTVPRFSPLRSPKGQNQSPAEFNVLSPHLFSRSSIEQRRIRAPPLLFRTSNTSDMTERK